MPDRSDPTVPVPAPRTDEAGATGAAGPPGATPKGAPRGAVDRFFSISARGSDFGREIRGGFATFFTMAYILVLNPIILGSAEDKFGNHLSGPQLVTATALVAAVMTVAMGVGGNLPLALAAGLGLNAVVAFQIAPLMSWPDAMGLIVIEGLLICVFVVTGLREAIMHAIPSSLKQAIGVGIGLFIAFIGFVDAGFVTRIPGDTGSVPVQLGATGQLSGWPVLVFCLGVLLTVALLARKVKGAILIGIVVTTVVAVVIDGIADIAPTAWGLTVPSVPDDLVAAPDFGLIGSFSLFGAFEHVGVVTLVLLVFTLLLSDFFDTMGTVLGVSQEVASSTRTARCRIWAGSCSSTARRPSRAAPPPPPPPRPTSSPPRASAKAPVPASPRWSPAASSPWRCSSHRWPRSCPPRPRRLLWSRSASC